jgi:glycosyltransferase involved in cell wall biosynthesis
LRLAVASPFVDRRHGTERAVAELLERLAGKYGCEVYLYAQRVENLRASCRGDVPSEDTGTIIWRRIPSVPGPHLLGFISWYLLNRWRRAWDRYVHRIAFDFVFPPGINCSDADVVFVHAVFHRLAELQRLSPQRGLRAIHRRAYYRMVCGLERRIYSNPWVALAAVSRHTARQLERFFGRNDVTVIPYGVDADFFRPEALVSLREAARQTWNIASRDIVLVLIGNDWRNKGLPALLEAITLCRELPLRLLVVGQDDPAPFAARVRQLDLAGRVAFALPSSDVRTFYAAADILAVPSLEDSFNLPALEAMACGIPVILSPEAGVSEWITPGEDAILLRDPLDVRELAQAIRLLIADPERMARLGQNAVRTASTLTWDRHAEAVFELLSRLKKS